MLIHSIPEIQRKKIQKAIRTFFQHECLVRLFYRSVYHFMHVVNEGMVNEEKKENSKKRKRVSFIIYWFLQTVYTRMITCILISVCQLMFCCSSKLCNQSNTQPGIVIFGYFLIISSFLFSPVYFILVPLYAIGSYKNSYVAALSTLKSYVWAFSQNKT